MRIVPVAAYLAPLIAAKVRAMPGAAPAEALPARQPPAQGPALTSLDMLVALSAMRVSAMRGSAATPSRAASIRRATRGLSLLGDLERAYLGDGCDAPGLIDALRGWLDEQDDCGRDADPALAALHDEMQLRVRVELAKLDRSI